MYLEKIKNDFRTKNSFLKNMLLRILKNNNVDDDNYVTLFIYCNELDKLAEEFWINCVNNVYTEKNNVYKENIVKKLAKIKNDLNDLEKEIWIKNKEKEENKEE